MRALLLACAMALAGCAAAPPHATLERPAGVTAADLPPRFELSGRVSVHEKERGFSGGLRWQHDPERDTLLLITPLGQGVAEILRLPGEARLTTPDSQHVAPDAETLTEQLLGWRLPLAGLAWWALGSNAPGSPAKLELDDEGRVTRVLQDGWEIRYLRYVAVEGRELPGSLAASRETLEIRLSVDQWNIKGAGQ
ncbi:MAG TPA: lipoprotein insertase outer membrane protein LolB [Burkholderiales bacterium]